jgi:hypothetical protein
MDKQKKLYGTLLHHPPTVTLWKTLEVGAYMLEYAGHPAPPLSPQYDSLLPLSSSLLFNPHLISPLKIYLH